MGGERMGENVWERMVGGWVGAGACDACAVL